MIMRVRGRALGLGGGQSLRAIAEQYLVREGRHSASLDALKS
jgi:hypothetical protein